MSCGSRRSEQQVGRGAVGLALVAVRGNAGDLGLEQRDPIVQFGARIWVERLFREKARGIARGPGALVVIHRSAASCAARLLSTGRAAIGNRSVTLSQQGRMWGARAMSETITDGLPESITAVGFAAPGPPEVLRPETMAMPRPGAGEVLVKVAFAGVNRPDVIQRMGFYPAPPGASPIPGLEISGTIAALGAGVEPALLGQQVCALVAGGGYAEYCIAVAEMCLPVPADMPLDQAAAIPETLFTVWHNVFERGWAREGETILVHGGTSGIGSMAILLARAFGMQVLVTCGGPEKCAAAREIGATLAIDYKAQDFVEAVAEFTAGKGVNLVLDMVAGDYVARNLKCLAEDGRHVTIAVQGGVRAELNMAEIMRKRLTLSGSTLRPRTTEFKVLLAQEIARTVWPLFESGEIRPVMDRAFPLANAADAHARMEAGDHIGKIVLEV